MSLSTLHFAILFSLLGGTHLVIVTIPEKNINVTDGQSVTLLCTFTTTASETNLNIQWSFISSKSMTPVQIYYYEAAQTFISKQFQGRLGRVAGQNNASITINNTQPSDSGMYTCEVNNMPDFQGHNQGNIFLSVLVKPSTPFCSVHGTVESGHLVTLTCHSEHGTPPPAYTWNKVDKETNRNVLGTMNIQTGVMKISNLSQFEFGQYQCNASNILGSAVCVVELYEVPHGAEVVGAVIGAVCGAALIGLIVWYVTHKMRRRKYKAGKAAATDMEVKAPVEDPVKYQSVPTAENEPVSNAAEVPPESTPGEDKPEQEEA
uniref:V-set and immunoglobulin domain-containing protein 1 n=1 Tax=Lepisosteus oculatus TaxID=7918 RepID=W5N8J8_LEPOC|nr:PREDICTED: V-set and immunoglobulin domain-containing protein 1 isoform X1 [Lepisosteus oculatus]